MAPSETLLWPRASNEFQARCQVSRVDPIRASVVLLLGGALPEVALERGKVALIVVGDRARRPPEFLIDTVGNEKHRAI